MTRTELVTSIVRGIAPALRALAARISALETRDPPAIAFDATSDGNRTVTFTYRSGDHVVSRAVKFPVVIYRGVWDDARAYEAGDQVTWSGSQWIARADNAGARPGLGVEASRVWTLSAKAGRNGHDGKDAANGAPPQWDDVRRR